MGEKWPIKMNNTCRQTLSLAFVACDPKSQLNGKLLSLHLKRQYISQHKRNSWNDEDLACMRSCSYNGFNDIVMKCTNCISASIHTTIMEVEFQISITLACFLSLSTCGGNPEGVMLLINSKGH